MFILRNVLFLVLATSFVVKGQDVISNSPPSVAEKPHEWLNFSESLNASLADLCTKYLDEAKKIDQKFFDRSEKALQSFLSSLESARKAAMIEDKLDKAIEFDELKTQYATWSSWNSFSESKAIAKKDRKKEQPLLLDFQKMVESIIAERTLSIQTLDKQFLGKANAKRNEFLDSYEAFRLKAMKADDLSQAKLIREEIKRVKEMEITVPSTDEIEPAEELPTQDAGKRKEATECVTVLKPIGRSGQTKILIPADVVRVEVAFFANDSQPEMQRSRYPGFQGTLRVNEKLVIAFSRKYKWHDGKTYTLSVAFDGSDVNTRDPATETGAFDVTSLVEPGKECTVVFSHGQRSPVGVRLFFYRIAKQ